MFEIIYRKDNTKPIAILAMLRLRSRDYIKYGNRYADKSFLEELYKNEIEWLNKNIGTGAYEWDYGSTFTFDLEEDAMAFKLKFL